MNIRITLCFILALLVVSCGGDKKSNSIKPKSGGTPYEVVIVATDDTWNSPIGDTLRSTLKKPVDYINFDEPSFDIINIHPKKFSAIYTKHRNLIIISVDPKHSEPKAYLIRDRYASPQTITMFEAATKEAMNALVANESNNVFLRLEEEEQKRFANRVSTLYDKKISEKIKQTFGFEMKIPRGYEIKSIKEPNFMWISYEMPVASQGVIIYDYPYDGQPITEESIVRERDRFLSNIPSQAANSQMKTSDAADPELTQHKINSQLWYVLRGYWNVKNDFMGGPFVSYTTIDTKRNRVVVIDTYVYSPDHTKRQRNFIRQMESLVRTVKF